MKVLRVLPLLFVLFELSGCVNLPFATTRLDMNQEEYIKYLKQRIEALEQRTERNEQAILGVNHRVNGLADLVSDPSANDSFSTMRRGK